MRLNLTFYDNAINLISSTTSHIDKVLLDINYDFRQGLYNAMVI